MKNLSIVLVGTKYPRNIGLVSRVLENFGIERLILVRPACTLNEEAKQGAAQGQSALSSVTIYENWQEFNQNEPEGLRIGLSRRQGRRRASLPLRQTVGLSIVNSQRPTYLIFGSEDKGLSAEDLQDVHRTAFLELPGKLQSMNLSHAVLLSVQIFFQNYSEADSELKSEAEPLKDPEAFLRLWLESLNFDLETHKRWNALTMLKQLILKASPTNQELHKLEMIVQQTVRRIKSQEDANSRLINTQN